MENTIFLKIEIIIFILSVIYILYYIVTWIIWLYLKVKKVIQPKKINTQKTAINKVDIWNKKSSLNNTIKINSEDREKLDEIVKAVDRNIQKRFYDIAKNLIVEWLSIDKYNKDLNLFLAFICEKEKKYSNAIFIYKDLLTIFVNNIDIMKKLGYAYALDNKLLDSFTMYEKVHNWNKWDFEVIDILSELAFELKNYKKAKKYINLFLSEKPRNINKLFMKAECYESEEKFNQAKNVYEKILEIQPYNQKAKEIFASL